jgi:hypothetical protein
MTKIQDYLKEIGKKGGTTTKQRHGKEHYQRLAEHMNQVRKQKKADQSK